MRRIEQISSTIVETFTFFIRSSAYLLVGRSSIPTLLKRVQNGRAGTGNDADIAATSATRVLEYISKHRPQLYKAHVAELTKALTGDGKQDRVIETALHAASKLHKDDSMIVVEK